MEKTNGSLPLDEQSQKILFGLLDGDKKISYFLPITNDSYHTLRNKIRKLEDAGLIKREEKKRYGDKGPKIIIISLTEKGRIVAEALKKAEWVANLPPEKIEKFARIKAYIHINSYDDHVTLKEVHLGESRIINIYVKPRGNLIYFYCDYHDSDDCEHVEIMFADPDISDYIRDWLNKNGYKLAKKYQKYVNKYW